MRLFAFVILCLSSVSVLAQDFASETEEFERKDGLLTVFTDTKTNRMRVLLPAPDDNGEAGTYLYATYLSAGLGSNDVGLDRNAGRSMTGIMTFDVVGDTVKIVAENTDFIASADNPFEQASVEKSFAKSILWSGKIIATEPETGKLLIDLSSFISRDVGIASQLKSRGQGSFSHAKDLSYVNVDTTLVFPKNVEFDSTLTFKSTAPGGQVWATTPEPNNVTLMTHLSIVELPDDGYKTREADERTGTFTRSIIDMSAPLEGSVVRKFALRHRLEKTDPTAARSTVKEPIIYYVDNGAPEDIRNALMEGASWWSDAFDAAGFIDGFQVKILPDDAHPLDIRYNIISWVHRQTRGWSYGGSVSDPRTGEIIKGNVTLGSLRLRQDIKIFEGLAGAANTGSGAEDDPVKLALDRVRQLSAHEVGHTIGFGHNFAASSLGERTSVMDYPAPWVTLNDNGSMNFSKAYDQGIGRWDVWTVKWLYGEYAPGADEAAGQRALVAEADANGLVFLDNGGRSPSSGNWRGNTWDNGAEPVESLREVMAVRAAALKNFGTANLRKGERTAALQDKIVPIYLYHRYQLQAAAKVLGGMDFSYTAKGDGRAPSKMLPRAYQEEALAELIKSLSPDALTLREDLIALLSPTMGGNGDPQFSRETFKGGIDPAFNQLKAAAVASDLTLDLILNPARAGRLVSFKARDANQLGLEATLNTLINSTLKGPRERDSAKAAVERVVDERVVAGLITLASNASVDSDVRSITEAVLDDLQGWFERSRSRDKISKYHKANLADQIARYKARPVTAVAPKPRDPSTPPGSPIGAGEDCWFCE